MPTGTRLVGDAPKEDAVLAQPATFGSSLLLALGLGLGASSLPAQEAAVEPAPGPAADGAPASSWKERGEAYARLGRALFAIRAGEYATAVEEIHGALAAQPDSAELMIQAADLMMLMHREGEAERLARRALSIDPAARDAMLFLADIGYERARRAPAEAKDRREAIRLYGDYVAGADGLVDPEVLRKLAHLQILDQEIDRAIATARRLVAERPGDRQATMMLTELLIQAQRKAEGLEVLLRYLALHPWDDELREWGTDLMDEFDGWALAAEILARHEPFRSDDTGIHLFYAQALERTGRLVEAARVLERARAARPDEILVRRNLVVVYRKLGRMADTVALIDELIAEDPAEPLYRIWLADTLENQGDVEGALAAYAAAVERLGTEAEQAAQRDAFRQRIVLLRLTHEDPEGARAALLELEEQESAVALEARARLAMVTEDWDEAAQAVRKLKAIGDEELDSAATLLEGEIALAQRRFSDASSSFDQAIARFPPVVRARVAELYREAGRAKSGEQLLREWIELEPEAAEAHYHLGAFLYQLDRIEESERAMRRAIELDGEHAPALNFLGYSLAERAVGLDEALLLVERALAVDAYNGAYLDSLGWVYFQMGRYGDARPPLESAARELPKDPTVLEHLGDVYARLGERSLARETWTRALAAGPEDPTALESKLRESEASPGGGDDTQAEALSNAGELPVPR
jgi:predicted Zn-dependent protease